MIQWGRGFTMTQKLCSNYTRQCYPRAELCSHCKLLPESWWKGAQKHYHTLVEVPPTHNNVSSLDSRYSENIPIPMIPMNINKVHTGGDVIWTQASKCSLCTTLGTESYRTGDCDLETSSGQEYPIYLSKICASKNSPKKDECQKSQYGEPHIRYALKKRCFYN